MDTCSGILCGLIADAGAQPPTATKEMYEGLNCKSIKKAMTLRKIGLSHCVNNEARKLIFGAFLHWLLVHLMGH